MKKKLYTSLTIAIMILIFLFSSQSREESSKTSGFILSLLPFFNNIESAEFYIRKLAHFSIYFLLGLSAFQMFSAYDHSKSKAFLFSILLCFFYACSDEFHQSFSSGRSPQVFDVFIDTMGAFISSFLSCCFFYKK